MKKIINNLDKLVILIAIILFVIIGLKANNNDEKEKNMDYLIDNSIAETVIESSKEISSNPDTNKDFDKTETNTNIMVHVTGCVKKQGVYSLTQGSRVNDLVEIAGGLCKDADLERINLSSKLLDEMKIHIYKIGEKDKTEILQVQNDNSVLIDNTSQSKKININTASKDELMGLSGIGETRAMEIIEYRKNNIFEKIEDIMNISGIGSKTFEKIKENITID